MTGSLTPWIAARYGWTASFLVASALCLVGAVSWLLVDPRKTFALASPQDSLNGREHGVVQANLKA